MINAATTVLVTGASSGIGRVTAKYLQEAGYRVFGTSRNPTQSHQEGFPLIQLDITDAESVERCIQYVLDTVGSIDVLVNNAGVDMVGAFEENTLEDGRWVFETNFFGTANMIRTVLPYMRAQGQGRIINITSALGVAAFPFESYYCSSKYAIEGLTESIRYELSLFPNIHICTVQPGFFQSEMVNRQREPAQTLAAYAPIRQNAVAYGKKFSHESPDPLPVAKTIERIIRTKTPKRSYPVGIEAHLAPPLAHALPESWIMKAGRWLLGVDDWRKDMQTFGVKAGGVGLLGLIIYRIFKRNR